jgi:hypothetical protein
MNSSKQRIPNESTTSTPCCGPSCCSGSDKAVVSSKPPNTTPAQRTAADLAQFGLEADTLREQVRSHKPECG